MNVLTGTTSAGMGSTVIMLVLMIAIFYFMLIRPESKRKKQAEEMRSSLKKGDWLTTIGGVYGRVVSITDRTVVIETSEDRVRMEITKWAISTTGVQSSTEAKAAKKKDEEKADEKAEDKPAEEPVDEIPAPEEESK